jgi:hypothetical protein
MDYWVLKSNAPDGGVIDAYPANGPTGWKYGKGAPLAREFPSSATVKFSKMFPDFRALYDFQPNTLSTWIVSRRVQGVIEQLQLQNAELLPVTIKDHQGAVAAEGYAFLNLIGAEDAIDLHKSRVTMDPMEKDQIGGIDEIILQPKAIKPDAKMFRCSAERRLFLIRDDVKQAFESAGLTGFRTFAANGWNGFDF